MKQRDSFQDTRKRRGDVSVQCYHHVFYVDLAIDLKVFLFFNKKFNRFLKFSKLYCFLSK